MGDERPIGTFTAAPPAAKPRLQIAAILRGAREIIIEHAGEEYRLRVTKNGKLILTK